MGEAARLRGTGGAMRLEVRDGTARVVLDAPEQKVNLLSAAALQELSALLEEIRNRAVVRCLVVSSGKPGNFIAGVDLHDLQSITDVAGAAEKSRQGQEIFNRLDDLPFPTVALIDGAAVGGGLELALACDYRIVTDSPRTRLSLPETQRGIVPGFGGTYRLPRIVGTSQALRMILSGAPVDGPRAARMGLADACYPSAFLEDRAADFIKALVAQSAAHGPRPWRRAPVRRRRTLLTAVA